MVNKKTDVMPNELWADKKDWSPDLKEYETPLDCLLQYKGHGHYVNEPIRVYFEEPKLQLYEHKKLIKMIGLSDKKIANRISKNKSSYIKWVNDWANCHLYLTYNTKGEEDANEQRWWKETWKKNNVVKKIHYDSNNPF